MNAHSFSSASGKPHLIEELSSFRRQQGIVNFQSPEIETFQREYRETGQLGGRRIKIRKTAQGCPKEFLAASTLGAAKC
jgi:hypothetical protein